MTGITSTRANLFKGWQDGENSRIVGKVGEEYALYEEEPRVKILREWIAQYHTSEVQEPYFYSARKIRPVDWRAENEGKMLILAAFICVSISAIIFRTTRSYFETAWKTCEVLANKKEYIIKNIFTGIQRCATAKEIWDHLGYGFLSSLRGLFCLIFPFPAFLGCAALIFKACERRERSSYHLIVDRSKDERVCPSNFDIQCELDPLTQEEIPPQKLHSPQMIYLPNYVTEAKSFVLALLITGKKNFSDPVYRREFTTSERKEILSQIEKIFLISENQFNTCFEKEDYKELFLDSVAPNRYFEDERIFDEDGEYAKDANDHLQGVLGEDTNPAIYEIDRSTNQIPNTRLRKTMKKIGRMRLLAITDYVQSLRKDDKAHWRIFLFEQATGLLLKDSDQI